MSSLDPPCWLPGPGPGSWTGGVAEAPALVTEDDMLLYPGLCLDTATAGAEETTGTETEDVSSGITTFVS